MTEFTLKTDEIDARYDATEKLLIVVYQGVLSPEVTSQFYGWLINLMKENPALVAEARGSIYDFRQVTDFQSKNITTARRESSSVTQTADVRDHPVALVVESKLQERMVESTMRITQQTDRKRVVHTIEEAKAFIDDWHQEND